MFPIERNGVANIVMLLRVAKQLGKTVDLDAIEREAVITGEYMHQLEGSSPISYGDFKRAYELKGSDDIPF